VEADILKPDTGSVPFERPSQLTSKHTSVEGSSGDHTPIETGNRGYVEPVSEGEEDESMDMAPAKDEHKRAGLSGAEVEEAIAFRERMLKERQHESAVQDESEDERTPFLKTRRASSRHILGPKPRVMSIDPLAPSSAFDNTLRDRLKESTPRGEHEEDDDGDDERDDTPQPSHPTDDRILSREFSAPAGKRIAVPVRIEPKVYFASERTFLVRTDFAVSPAPNLAFRNGFIFPFTLAPLPRRYSTLSSQVTRTDSSLQRCSPSWHCSPSRTQPSYSCIAR
jgi:hypothetical protein